jgi:hypothetical protein
MARAVAREFKTSPPTGGFEVSSTDTPVNFSREDSRFGNSRDRASLIAATSALVRMFHVVFDRRATAEVFARFGENPVGPITPTRSRSRARATTSGRQLACTVPALRAHLYRARAELRRFVDDIRGAALVEAAIALPVLTMAEATSRRLKEHLGEEVARYERLAEEIERASEPGSDFAPAEAAAHF